MAKRDNRANIDAVTMPVRWRLIIWMFILSTMPLAMAGFLNVKHAKNSLQQSAEEYLSDSVQNRSESISSWFENRIQELQRLSANDDYARELLSLADKYNQQSSSLKQFTSSDKWRTQTATLRRDISRIAVHHEYIYDIFLIDLQGNVLFTVAEESDLGTNLKVGAYASTRFAEAVRESLDTKKATFSDFERYPPSEGLLCGFFAAPILDSSRNVIGVIALQTQIDRLYSILASSSDRRYVNYLVGADGLLRASGAKSDWVPLVSAIDTLPVQAWLQGHGALKGAWNSTGSAPVIQQYNGPNKERVLGAARPLKLLDTHWLMLSELDYSDIANQVAQVAKTTFIVMLVSALAVFLIAFFLARQFVKPIEQLAASADAAAQGDLDQSVNIQSKDEIGYLADAFNRMLSNRREYERELRKANEQAQAASRAKNDFLACMSHEIRTPMNGVLGMLGLVKNTPLTAEQSRKLDIAHSSAQSLLGLINDILDFSKVESGKLELECFDFSVMDQITELVREFSIAAEEKNIELMLDVSSLDNRLVYGDPSRLRQVVSNLVSNAIKFTQQGEVIVKASFENAEHNSVQFKCAILDTGIGIAPEYVSSLFDSFSQADASTTRKFGGTGLGLAITKSLCELMGGSISANSTVGEGSEFSFSVRYELSDRNQVPEIPNMTLEKLTALVVDDNSTNREILTQQLHSWGAEVVEMADARSAIDYLNSENRSPINIALLDYQMPGMDGISLASEIAAIDRSIGLMLLSSVSHSDALAALKEKHFDAHLIKPVSASELFDALTLMVDAHVKVDVEKPDRLITSNSLRGYKTNRENSDAQQRFDGAKVLVVEDNTVNQEVVLSMLNDLGILADVADNGVLAFDCLNACAASVPYQLIFMDCQMPGMDGYETTQKIREGLAGEAFTYVPIVAMTANAMQGDREKCIASGMNDYISKPINLDGVVQMLSKWLPVRSVVSNNNSANDALSASDKKPDWTMQGDLKLPNNLVTIDFAKKRPDIARRAKSYLRLLAMYCKQNKSFIEVSTGLYEANNLEALREHVHTLKGSSGNLGMMVLFEKAAEIESTLRSEATLHTDELRELYRLVSHSLSDAQMIIDLNGSEVVSQTIQNYHEVRSELIDKLKKNMLVDQRLQRDFEQSARNHIENEVLEDVINSLEIYEYAQALALMRD